MEEGVGGREGRREGREVGGRVRVFDDCRGKGTE